jgi:LacI family transcriptional regulator
MNNMTIQPDSAVPKVRQIETQIRERIISGDLPSGFKLPSMRDLAQQLCISVGIVKQALNTLTTEGFLQTTPKTGVFVSDSPPLRNIALVLPSIELEQIARMVRATRTHLPQGFQLVIEASSAGYVGQVDLLKNIKKNRVAGVLLPTPNLRKYALLLQEALDPEVPCIQCVFELDNLKMDSVTADGFTMGKIAVEHLIRNGHRKIGLVTNYSDSRTFRDRIKGMDFTLRQIGQSYEKLPQILIEPDGLDPDAPWLTGKEATTRLLQRHPTLTAIIGGNGHITLGAIQAINETGRSIPNDISLIAMELDLPSFEHTVPPITAIDKPLEQIFARATELLIDRINNPDQPLRAIHLPPILHERESVKTLIGS